MSEEQENQTQSEPDPTVQEEFPEPVDDQPEEASHGIDLDRVRDLVLAANPDVVPEMIQGQSFDELMASVESAREAYQRIADQAKEQAASDRNVPRIAAQPGRRGATIVDIEGLSPLGKISEGLRRL